MLSTALLAETGIAASSHAATVPLQLIDERGSCWSCELHIPRPPLPEGGGNGATPASAGGPTSGGGGGGGCCSLVGLAAFLVGQGAMVGDILRIGDAGGLRHQGTGYSVRLLHCADMARVASLQH